MNCTLYKSKRKFSKKTYVLTICYDDDKSRRRGLYRAEVSCRRKAPKFWESGCFVWSFGVFLAICDDIVSLFPVCCGFVVDRFGTVRLGWFVSRSRDLLSLGDMHRSNELRVVCSSVQSRVPQAATLRMHRNKSGKKFVQRCDTYEKSFPTLSSIPSRAETSLKRYRLKSVALTYLCCCLPVPCFISSPFLTDLCRKGRNVHKRPSRPDATQDHHPCNVRAYYCNFDFVAVRTYVFLYLLLCVRVVSRWVRDYAEGQAGW